VLADPDFAGPGVRRLAEIIRESVDADCARRDTVKRPERVHRRGR
jgi:hypothetical protein